MICRYKHSYFATHIKCILSEDTLPYIAKGDDSHLKVFAILLKVNRATFWKKKAPLFPLSLAPF